MSAALLRTSALRSALRTGTPSKAGLAGVSFARGKATLPDLPYAYNALEPAISSEIMELHHKNHHQTYVNSFNAASESLAKAQESNDIAAQLALQPVLNFHGGGHINHSLFWENLAPSSQGGGDAGYSGGGKLASAIDESFGGLEPLKAEFGKALAGIQGSGWAWLVQDTQTGKVEVRSYANQDPVVGRYIPLLGVDAWEHAYYLQYQNRKAEYFKKVWEVVNWKAAEERFAKV